MFIAGDGVDKNSEYNYEIFLRIRASIAAAGKDVHHIITVCMESAFHHASLRALRGADLHTVRVKIIFQNSHMETPHHAPPTSGV
jgi:hypothetical protein